MSFAPRTEWNFHKAIAVTGMTLTSLLLAGLCFPQNASGPKFNTASAGVRQSDIEAAVDLICPSGDITRSKDGRASGCRTCPKGTDFQGVNGPEWEMYAETPGHFTSADGDNLLLDGTGCDSHANNFGGSFMFVVESGQLRLVTYEKGLVTDECHKFALSDGRDYLVCRGGWSGQGESTETVFTAAFRSDGKATTTQLIAVRDTTGMCGDDPDQVAQESSVKDIEVSHGQSGQIPGLTITATLGEVKCSQASTAAKSGKLPASVKTYKIEFLFDGKRFNVAPSSRSTFNRFHTD